jgi:hypothetical protein
LRAPSSCGDPMPPHTTRASRRQEVSQRTVVELSIQRRLLKITSGVSRGRRYAMRARRANPHAVDLRRLSAAVAERSEAEGSRWSRARSGLLARETTISGEPGRTFLLTSPFREQPSECVAGRWTWPGAVYFARRWRTPDDERAARERPASEAPSTPGCRDTPQPTSSRSSDGVQMT